MDLVEFINKLDRETLIKILLKIIDEFPIIKFQITEMMKEMDNGLES